MYLINISVNLIFGFYRSTSLFCPNSIIFYCFKNFIRKNYLYNCRVELFQFAFFTSVSNSIPMQNPFLKLVFSSSKLSTIVSFIRLSNSAAEYYGAAGSSAIIRFCYFSYISILPLVTAYHNDHTSTFLAFLICC